MHVRTRVQGSQAQSATRDHSGFSAKLTFRSWQSDPASWSDHSFQRPCPRPQQAVRLPAPRDSALQPRLSGEGDYLLLTWVWATDCYITDRSHLCESDSNKTGSYGGALGPRGLAPHCPPCAELCDGGRLWKEDTLHVETTEESICRQQPATSQEQLDGDTPWMPVTWQVALGEVALGPQD